MITDIYTETESDYDDTDHAVSPTSSSSSWRGRDESGTITARARTSTNKHENEKDKTQQSSFDSITAYLLSSSILRNYVQAILLEDSVELINDLLREFKNWFREEIDFCDKLIKIYCEKEEFDKVNILMAQRTTFAQLFREQVHLIRLHCDEITAREERTLSEMSERLAEDDNIEQLDDWTDEQSDEESLETSNNTFLPQTNVASDEADSYSLNGSTEDDGGVEPPELNDDPFLSRSDIESSDENEDDNMTDMLSSISDSSNDLTESEPEEPPETEDNTSLSRPNVGTHRDDETNADPQNDLTENEAEDEWFQAVGNSSPMDPESHDIETAVTSYTNGQNNSHSIVTSIFESVQTNNNNETFESNKTVPDISAELSKELMLRLDLHKEGPFKSENLRNDLSFKTLRIMTNRKGKPPEEPTETEEEPFHPQPDTVTHNKALNQNRSEVKIVINHNLLTSDKPLFRTKFIFKLRQVKQTRFNVKLRSHQRCKTDQILTNKTEEYAVWMLEVLRRYFRQHFFKSSKPPLVL